MSNEGRFGSQSRKTRSNRLCIILDQGKLEQDQSINLGIKIELVFDGK
jgi:hypothetical protein